MRLCFYVPSGRQTAGMEAHSYKDFSNENTRGFLITMKTICLAACHCLDNLSLHRIGAQNPSLEKQSLSMTEKRQSSGKSNMARWCSLSVPRCIAIQLEMRNSRCLYKIFMLFLSQNTSPLFFISHFSSFSVIPLSIETLSQNSVEKRFDFVFFFFLESLEGHAIYRQNTQVIG